MKSEKLTVPTQDVSQFPKLGCTERYKKVCRRCNGDMFYVVPLARDQHKVAYSECVKCGALL